MLYAIQFNYLLTIYLYALRILLYIVSMCGHPTDTRHNWSNPKPDPKNENLTRPEQHYANRRQDILFRKNASILKKKYLLNLASFKIVFVSQTKFLKTISDDYRLFSIVVANITKFLKPETRPEPEIRVFASTRTCLIYCTYIFSLLVIN